MRTRSRLACISAAVAALSYGGLASARDLTWDADGATPPLGSDGSGTWNTTDPNWVDGDLITGTNVTWINSPADSAIFGNDTNALVGTATPNNIEFSEPITADNISIGIGANGGIYSFSDFSGGSLTVNGSVTKTASAGTVNMLLLTNGLTLGSPNVNFVVRDTGGDAAPEMSINGEVKGTAGITLDNGAYDSWGTLALNIDNSYTGVTNIVKGRLIATTAGALGTTGSGTTISNLGTFSIGGANTVVNGLTIAEPFTITRNTYDETYKTAFYSQNGTGTHTLTAPQMVLDTTEARFTVKTSRLIINSDIVAGPNVANPVMSIDGKGESTGTDYAGYIELHGNNTGLAAGGIKLLGGAEVQVFSQANLGGASAPITFAGDGTLGIMNGFMTDFGTHVVNFNDPITPFNGGLNIPTGQTFNIPESITGVALGKRGEGTLNLGGTNVFNNDAYYDAGTVNITGDTTYRSIRTRNATLNIGTSAKYTTTGAFNSIAVDSGENSTVNLTGTGQFISNSTSDFNISDNANTTALINISDSAVLSHAGLMHVAKNAGGNGKIVQTGGTLSLTRSGDFTLVLGSRNGSGTYELSNGVANINGQFYVGQGTGSSIGQGTFTMTGGTVNLNNWFSLGRERGTGTVDISAGTFNKTGGGNTSIDERSNNGQASTMTLRGTAKYISTSGEFFVGNEGGSDGILNVQDDAEIQVNNYFVVGRFDAKGTLNFSGGTITKAGGGGTHTEFDVNGGAASTVTMSGDAAYFAQTGDFRVAQGGGANCVMTVKDTAQVVVTAGQFWVGNAGGNGTLNLEGGSITGNNWMALGRQGGSTGVINQSGGTFTKQGSNWLAIGSGGSGTYNQTGGTLISNNTYVGEASNGTLAISGGTSTFTGDFNIGQNGGVFGTFNLTAAANVSVPNVKFGNNGGAGGGTLNLDGGTLTAGSFTNGAGTGAKVFNFNGGTLKPAASTATFMQGLTAANVQNGGANLDTSGFDVTIAQPLLAAGTGGLSKVGAGTATFNGANTYTGPTSVTAGTLAFGSSLTQSSGVTVTNATLRMDSGGGNNRVLKTSSISLTNGKIDLTDNKLITPLAIGTHNGSNYTGVTGLVEQGRNGGFWNGNGITTSMSDATSGSNYTMLGVATGAEVLGLGPTDTATWGGQTVSGSDSLVMYTYGGDANLSGFVDIDDYGQIDFNASTGGVLTGWFNGDFDYNGIQDIDDYGIIDFVVNIQGAPFATAGGATGGMSIAAVPEPTAGALLALGAGAMFRRKRRK